MIGCQDTASSAGVSASDKFEGKMGEIFIIARYAMTASDVTDFYNGGKPKNMTNFQSSNARRVYYRADNYNVATNGNNHAIRDFNKGLEGFLIDPAKSWSGTGMDFELGANVTQTEGVTIPSVLDGLPSYGDNGVEVTGCTHFKKDNDDGNDLLFKAKIDADATANDEALIQGAVYYVSIWNKLENSTNGVNINIVNGHGSVVQVGWDWTATWTKRDTFMNVITTDSIYPGPYAYSFHENESGWVTGLVCKKLGGKALVNPFNQNAASFLSFLPVDEIKV